MDELEQPVKELLNKAEYAIFVASLPAKLPSLTDRELRGEITRCRQARDRSRTHDPGTGLKAAVFDDALRRLEHGLALRQVDAPPDDRPPDAAQRRWSTLGG